jgi:hypothetical protein
LIKGFLKYRQYRLRAAADRNNNAFFSGPALGGLASGVAIGFFSNFGPIGRVGLAAGGTFLGLVIDMGCRANPIDFVNKHGDQLDKNFLECMKGKMPNDCNFTAAEIQQMAEELIAANNHSGLILTPQEIMLLPSKVFAKMTELEASPPTPALAAPR